jgi:Bifunctional DNA primase/polymerase, N-terminal
VTADYAMLNAALDLARMGLPVFPLVPQGKKPRFEGSFHNATTDPTEITAHWRRHRHDNIGTRPPAGVIVLDVDPRHGGDIELACLTAEYGPLPETWTTQTGSKGLHYWLDLGGSIGAMRGTLCKGVDIKHHDNGYVVVPPSLHPCGQRYWWRKSPRGSRPTPAPPWLRMAVQRPNPDRWAHTVNGMNGHGEYTLQCLVARISAAREGNRNKTLYGALKDAQKQNDLNAFEADLVCAAVGTGLDIHEVEATLRSVRGSRP